MYGQFILIGDRLALRYELDRDITSVPEKPRPPAFPAPRKRERR